MKQKITFLLVCLICCPALFYGQTMINDFEPGSAATEPFFGASVEVVLNPDQAGLNTTLNCLQIGRTSTNWYELIRINVDPDLTVSDTDTKFLSMMVYGLTTDIGCRFDASDDANNGTNAGIIRPSVLHSGTAANWEQIIFPIVDSQTATNFTKGTLFNLIFHGDIGGAPVPGGYKLNETDAFILIDQIQPHSEPLGLLFQIQTCPKRLF